MLESTVELLGGLFLSGLTFLDRFLYRWLDCCGPTSGQPWKRYCEYKEVKEVFGFVAEVTVSDDHNRDVPYRSSNLSEEMHYG